MCGIAGVLGRVDEGMLDDMLSCVIHRGPDEDGRFVDGQHPLMMGMRRLSIIDIDEGTQPIYNEDDTVAVVFNGEIYNYLELRERLERAGHTFSTNSDTEVLVHGWEEYGERLPEHLNGMFAFSLWDATEKSLFLVRDRVGIKPLYYVEHGDHLYWASEIKPLLNCDFDLTLDRQAIYNYFSLRYFSWPQTPFKGIQKIEPGTSMLIDDEGTTKRKYWDLTSRSVPGDLESLSTQFREMLEESVQRRLMTDVPLGAFLSGGLDSSSIVGLMSKHMDEPVKTFSIGFEVDEYDESDEAAFVSDHFGTDHHEISVDLDAMDLFGDVVKHYGEPLADPAVLPTLAISRYASQNVKVVLSGEGADELFGGYWYFNEIPRHQQMFKQLPSQAFQLAGKLEPHSPVRQQTLRYVSALENNEEAILGVTQRFQEPIDRYLDLQTNADESGLRRIIQNTEQYSEDNDFYERMLAFDIKHWLPDDLLYKVDHASMSASLEARVPFLDHNLVEFGFNIPVKYKRDGYKPVVKRAMSDILPQRVLEREKHGLGVPVDRWFREGHDAIQRWMARDRLASTPYVRAEDVHALWSDHRAGTDHGLTLWKVLNYVAWYHEIAKGNLSE